MTAMAVVGVIVMVIGLLLTPLGVPGLWIMIAVLAAGAWYGKVSIAIMIVCVVLAAIAEVIEFLIVKRLNTKYGGSRLAFWGAIAGGIAGAMMGAPIFLIGPLIMGFLGTFVGAATATLYETKHLDRSTRVGWGVVLGRMWSAVAKVAAGVAILVLGGGALLW
jgi:uncharacterized protein YqgC (DUF456 family)